MTLVAEIHKPNLVAIIKSLTDDRFDSGANFETFLLHQRQIVRIEPFFQCFGMGAALAQAVAPLGDMRPLAREKLQLRVIEPGDVRRNADIARGENIFAPAFMMKVFPF